MDGEGKLAVTSTPNQDNPLMAHVADAAGTPVLGLGGWVGVGLGGPGWALAARACCLPEQGANPAAQGAECVCVCSRKAVPSRL